MKKLKNKIKFNITQASFLHLCNLHGIVSENTYRVSCFQDQEYYGESCYGSETSTTIKLPSGLKLVGYEVTPPKSERYFYVQIFKY